MSVLAALAVAVGLVLAHGLRVAPGGRRGLPSLFQLGAFLVAFAASALVIRIAADGMGLARRTDMDRIVVAALDAVPQDRPYILFLGASHSRNAVDPDGLEAALAERGLAWGVVSLSLEGASLQERTAGLSEFLAAAPAAPAIALLEISPEFDADPAYVFQVAKFSDRAITQLTPQATGRIAFALSSEGCGGAVSCLKTAAFTGAHLFLNAANVGLLASAEPLSTVGPLAAYAPEIEPRDAPSPDARREGLTASPRPMARPVWAERERTRQIALLAAAGTTQVGYYLPPVAVADKRAYASAFCDRFTDGTPCIASDDPALLAALDGPYWLDEAHLLQPGADIWTQWLADALAPALRGRAE